MSDGNDERGDRNLKETLSTLTTAINGLRYGSNNVTRCDLNAAEARLTDVIIGHREGMADLARLVTRIKKISGTLKALSGKFTQLDSSTEH